MTLISTDKTRQRFSRRAMLAGLGASAAFLPLINAERAQAAGPSGFPKRLITVTWGQGVCRSMFYPTDGSTKSQILAPMADYADKMLVVAGLDYKMMLEQGYKWDGHSSYPVIYTGTFKKTNGQNTCTGPSIDQVVADAVAKQVSLPQPLLLLNIDGESPSWRGADQRNTGESDPKRLFDKLFASATMPAVDLQNIRDRRKSVLDFVSGELTGFKQRMGTDDAAKIDAHLESIRQLETQLNAMSTQNCATPSVDTSVSAFQDKIGVMLDMVAMAIRCDITRAVSICWADDSGTRPITFPWLDINSSFHDLAHQGEAGYPIKSKAEIWMWQQVARLTNGLADGTEGTSTALDNSLIVVGNDMNDGAGHQVGGLPFVLIGSCQGYFKQGQTIKVGSWATNKPESYWDSDNGPASGVPHNLLLASISNAMDIPCDSFGEGYAGTLDSLVKA